MKLAIFVPTFLFQAIENAKPASWLNTSSGLSHTDNRSDNNISYVLLAYLHY